MRGDAAAQHDLTDLRPTLLAADSEQQARGGERRGWARFGAPFRAKKIKAQTEALHRNAERFRTLLQHSSDAVVVVGRDLRILHATGPVERMLGRCPGDLRGGTLADLVYPQEWPRVEALLTKTVEGPGATSTQDIRLRRVPLGSSSSLGLLRPRGRKEDYAFRTRCRAPLHDGP